MASGEIFTFLNLGCVNLAQAQEEFVQDRNTSSILNEKGTRHARNMMVESLSVLTSASWHLWGLMSLAPSLLL